MLPIEEIVLANGFRLLLVDRPTQSTVEAGWVIPTGSFDDPEGAAGMSHLLEHLLFKGTKTIGTRSYEREKPLLDEEDRLTAELERLPASGKRRQRRASLLEALSDVRRRATALARLGELSLHYSEAGATGLNAHTFKDFALHLVTLPAEKLELWFWLESDRLSNPVLREFHKEITVIGEERRQRIESTPGGEQDEAFEARFWGASNYAHRPLGRPPELQSISRSEARAFFDYWFQPDRLTAVLVGDLGSADVRKLAELYFGRLRPRNGRRAELAANAARAAQRRAATTVPDRTEPWRTNCACATQLRVLYPAVSFHHPDSYPLQVLSGVLNGRAGRLHRSLVVDRRLARSTASRLQAYRHEGLFALDAEPTGTHSPENLLEAWNEELSALHREPPAALEVTRVRNQLAADALRRLQDPAILRTQLLVYAGLGHWREIYAGPANLLEVTPGDVQRVSRTYLTPERSSIAFYQGPSQ